MEPQLLSTPLLLGSKPRSFRRLCFRILERLLGCYRGLSDIGLGNVGLCLAQLKRKCQPIDLAVPLCDL